MLCEARVKFHCYYNLIVSLNYENYTDLLNENSEVLYLVQKCSKLFMMFRLHTFK